MVRRAALWWVGALLLLWPAAACAKPRIRFDDAQHVRAEIGRAGKWWLLLSADPRRSHDDTVLRKGRLRRPGVRRAAIPADAHGYVIACLREACRTRELPRLPPPSSAAPAERPPPPSPGVLAFLPSPVPLPAPPAPLPEAPAPVPAAAPAPDCQGTPEPATAAGWTALWRAKGGLGWNGGDGAWSVRLPDGRLAWFFGDTFLDRYGADARFARNSVVVQDAACLTPLAGPAPEGDQWDWPAQPLVEGDVLHVLYARIARTGPGPWDFAAVGTDLATFDLPALTLRSVQPVPARADVHYGAATLVAGDWTYVYGVADRTKQLYLARAPRGHLEQPWGFWTGSGWSADAAQSAPLLDEVSNQLTVLPAADGDGLVLVSQAPQFGPEIHAFRAPAPEGPWTGPTTLATIPAPGAGRFVYNATVHPHLHDGTKLVVGYSVNGEDAWTDESVYRPRFLAIDRP